MSRPQLSETLTALVGAVPIDASATMVELDLDVPMEISLSREQDHLVVHAAPAHTRFVSGFLPVVHTMRLHIVASTDEESVP
jgi:hypothetical protein